VDSLAPVRPGTASTSHRYFAAWPYANSPLVELPGGANWDSSVLPEWRYPLSVLVEAEKELKTRPLHFYITKDADNLPEYGDHVVAILWQEERCKIPAYARHVRGVLRALQGSPFLGFHPHLGLNKYEAVLLFQYVRDMGLHHRSKRRMQEPHSTWPEPLHRIPRVLTIPLGYHSQEDLPQIPMAERALDAFFTGEIHSPVPKSSYRYWITSSKTQARRQLWDALLKLKQDARWRIDMGDISGGDSGPRPPGFHEYSQKMMNSRICLAPRGTVAETFRMYEGWRAGCLVIANQLPPEPFLKGAPVIEVDNWKVLPDLLKKYARDIDALEHYRKASLDFWKNHLSEQVIGQQVAHFLNGCPGGCP
jgi:hypothetical protein